MENWLPNVDEISSEVEKESVKYQDVLQFNFNEGYYNLSMKSLGMLHWWVKRTLSWLKFTLRHVTEQILSQDTL